MNKQTENALCMAIEVLEAIEIENGYSESMQIRAIQACKEALAQPAQEPVGYTTQFDLETIYQGNTGLWFANKNGKYNVALYTHPAPSCSCEDKK